MARPRRARPRTARAVVAGALAAVVVAGGAVAVWQLNQPTHAATSSPSVATSTATPDASPSASPSPSASSPSASSTTDPAAQQVLQRCQDAVRAHDAVLAAAATGVGHWREHVQAQTDANASAITVEQMDAIFSRTRLAGADDQKRYHQALHDASAANGSCDPVPGAPQAIATSMQQCSARTSAQQPVLQAAADAMADWSSHLAAMHRSRMGHVNDPQGVWRRAWAAAPPHLDAYREAVKGFDAPRC